MEKSIVVAIVLVVACGSPSLPPALDAASAGGATSGGHGGSQASATGGTPGGNRSGGTTMTGDGGAIGTGGVASTGTSSSGGVGSGGRAAGGASGSAGSAGSTGAGGRHATGGSAAGGAGTGGSQGGGSGGGGSARVDASSGNDAKADVASDGAARDVRVGDAAANLPSVTVYVAGDSTVSTYTNSSIHQAGWGQFLQDYCQSSATIVNKAVGGMTARHYIEAGYLDQIVSVMKSGDYLLLQFGTNDGNTTATYTLPGSSTPIPYYLDAATDFRTYLKKYVEATKAKGAMTIFVTPPPRHSCDSGETGVRNGLAAYATAMKDLGPTLNTPVVDLNAMTIAYLANVRCETSGQTFYLVKADGTVDSTHFQENGAKIMAGLVADGASGISTLGLPLSAYVK